MNKIARFIVEKRILFFILFAVLIVYCVFGMSKVGIEYSISSYLPKNTDTAKALDIMENEFVTFGTTKIMVKNVTFERADSLYREIKALEGVKSFTFENSEDYYNDACALFNITFVGDDGDAHVRADAGAHHALEDERAPVLVDESVLEQRVGRVDLHVHAAEELDALPRIVRGEVVHGVAVLQRGQRGEPWQVLHGRIPDVEMGVDHFERHMITFLA